MAINCTNITSWTPNDLERILFPILYILLCLFICGGNILTIVAVRRTPALRTVANMFVVSLAVADLMMGFLMVPMQSLLYIPSLSEIVERSKVVCIFNHMTYIISASLSIFFMMAIAFDRAIYIGYPLRYHTVWTVTRGKMVIIGGSFVSIIHGTVPIYYNNWNNCNICLNFRVLKAGYHIYILIVGFFLPSILTAVCYGYILKLAIQQQKETMRLEAPDARKRFGNDMKLVKLFMSVFGIFLACWIPNVIVMMVEQLTHAVPVIVIQIVTPLAVLNSGMNFIVYTVKNAGFRQAFYKILGFKCSVNPN
ncbi:hypothetical protein SNE40_020212 [Patella caerulea]|uniref:G-protein coupled receptors family 1 profile domain-containing protein n=1 Tax=Patella caerulea TaxID=87958 RepID=A0AAN8GA02_PATCE